MKSKKQVIYENLDSVYRLMKNALYYAKSPFTVGTNVTITSVEMERVKDALDYIENQSEKNSGNSLEKINDNKIEEAKKLINSMDLKELEIISIFMEDKLRKIPVWIVQRKEDDI